MEYALEEIRKAIRSEVYNCIFREFSDTDDFTKELKILSDDLSSMALVVEKKLGLKLPRKEYEKINNVETYILVIEKYLNGLRSDGRDDGGAGERGGDGSGRARGLRL